MSWTRRQWLHLSSTVITLSVCGCGTLLYPERRGQRAGRLDWRVVALDGIGLLFFFIPGVIAFAVDFINGTIYLPAEPTPTEPPCLPAPTGHRGALRGQRGRSLQQVSVPRRELTPKNIEKVIAQRTGKSISLEDGRYSTRPLDSIDEFWQTHETFDGESEPGSAS